MEMHSGEPHFENKDDEIVYLRDFVQRLIIEKEALQVEFEDYTSNSGQLEKEYEVTIEQNERTIKELRFKQVREQKENESLKTKYDDVLHENGVLQHDLEVLKEEKVQLLQTIRMLEQKNDDLERAERMRTETVAAYEASLNIAIERNAILESEIDEKETLKEKLQRLVDETRDLKQELQVKERVPDNDRLMNGHSPPTAPLLTNGNGPSAPAPPLTPHTLAIDSNRLKVECETQTTPSKRDSASRINLLDTPLSPSSRVLALNLIGDLMRKICQLEARVARRPEYCGSTESIRRRHPSRGRSSPSLQSINK